MTECYSRMLYAFLPNKTTAGNGSSGEAFQGQDAMDAGSTGLKVSDKSELRAQGEKQNCVLN